MGDSGSDPEYPVGDDPIASIVGEIEDSDKNDNKNTDKTEILPIRDEPLGDLKTSEGEEKYLFPVITAENLSDSIMSLEAAIYLARQLKRTLVLPRVGSGYGPLDDLVSYTMYCGTNKRYSLSQFNRIPDWQACQSVGDLL